MAAQILSGTVTPIGNYTLYTNNTEQNVRLIIHFLFVHGAKDSSSIYSTRRVNITGGLHGTLQLPANLYFQDSPNQVQRIRLGLGKDIALEDVSPEAGGNSTVTQNGLVRTIVNEGRGNIFAGGPQVFPTEILMRTKQSMVFEASSSTSRQYISFNITAIPEGG